MRVTEEQRERSKPLQIDKQHPWHSLEAAHQLGRRAHYPGCSHYRYPLPVLPVQILWVNMTTAVLFGLTLAFEPKEPGITDRPPRPSKEPILTKELIVRTLLVGALLLFAAFGLYLYEKQQGATIAEAQTVAATVLVVLEAFYLLSCRPMREIGFFSNMWVYYGIAAMFFFQALFMYVPFMNILFRSSPLDAMQLLRIFGAGALLLLIVTVEKYFRFKRNARKSDAVG